jgi:Glyoxalase/Bleomycin resistance protein/Dioxygenase superfamily
LRRHYWRMLQPPGTIIELCHVVTDMDTAIAHWSGDLGAGPFYVGEMRFEKHHKYRGRDSVLAIKVGFGFLGGLLIELIEPLEGDDSVFSETGPGYHHVMLREGYDTGFARMSAAGYPLALENLTPLGERCALFETPSGFVELMDLHLGFEHLTGIMADAHVGWDGTNPIRPMAILFEGLQHD